MFPLRKRSFRGQEAVTLTELMVAVFILGVVAVGILGSFGSIKVGVQYAKNRTVAANLCKEKLESLKNETYDRLRVTSQSDLNAYGYDNTYYLPETNLNVTGYLYNRYVRIKKAQEDASKNMVDVSPEDPDTGLKKVEVLVQWMESGSQKQYSMVSYLSDPNRLPLDGTVSGVVYKSPGGVGNELSGVSVVIQDNPSWNVQTDASGIYTLHITTGTHTIQFSKAGYFSSGDISISVVPNATQNFTMSLRGSGSVSGNAYLRDHPVISQVVADTDTVDAEYIELYNPSTNTYTADASTFRLYYIDKDNDNPGVGGSVDLTASMTFNSTTLPANGGHFLIANTSPVRAGGVTVIPDAVYSVGSAPDFAIKQSEAGGVVLLDSAGNVIDRVGWSKNLTGHPAPNQAIETAGISLSNGLNPGEQLVRWDTNTTAAMPSSSGRSWDSNDNSNDFNKQILTATKDMPLIYAPQNSSTIQSPQSGTPAVGAVVSADDDLSSPVTITSATGYFQLPGIATSTLTGAATSWTVSISSFSLYGSSVAVIVSAGGNKSVGVIPLTSSAITGLVTGVVSISTGGTISGIKVRCGATDATTNGAGFYQLVLPAGNGLTVVANPGNLNPNYTYDTYASAIDLSAGQSVDGVNFTLSPAGKITGRVTSNGTDPLPNVVINAEAPAGTQRGTTGSDSSGYFTISNLPMSSISGVGAYTVSPALDPEESASPGSFPATVTLGTTVNVGTFTVTGSLGKITGTVTDSGSPLTTGVIVMATLSTIASNPPDWNETLRNGSALYYSAHSTSDGSYSLTVRVSTSPYNVYAWYSTLSGQVATTVRKNGQTTVLNSTSTYSVSFSWP